MTLIHLAHGMGGTGRIDFGGLAWFAGALLLLGVAIVAAAWNSNRLED